MGDFSLGFAVGVILSGVIAVMMIAGYEAPETKIAKDVKHKCEATIPRDQVCKVVITAVVVEKEDER